MKKIIDTLQVKPMGADEALNQKVTEIESRLV